MSQTDERSPPMGPAIRPKIQPFYMVQGSQSNRAKKHHETFELAKAEATRLAELNPGKSYWVLKSVCTVKFVADGAEQLESANTGELVDPPRNGER